MTELENMVRTKVEEIGILTPTILHLDEIKNITKSECRRLTITEEYIHI